jgi:hypothetical protein
MTDQGLFIDNLGQLRYHQSPVVSGVQNSWTYLIKNLGWVQILQHPNLVRVNLRKAVCSELAIARLLFWLADQSVRRFQLFIYNDQTDKFECAFFQEAVNLSEVALWFDKAMSDQVSPTRRTCLDLARLRDSTPFGAAVKFWRQNNGQLNVEQVEQLARAMLANRFVVLKQADATSRMILSQVGGGMPSFALKTLRQMVGQPYEDHPDHQYGVACVKAYQQALTQWAPVAEHVDAVVKWPGFGRLRRTYTRLILPIQLHGSEPAVLCSTHPLGGIES